MMESQQNLDMGEEQQNLNQSLLQKEHLKATLAELSVKLQEAKAQLQVVKTTMTRRNK